MNLDNFDDQDLLEELERRKKARISALKIKQAERSLDDKSPVGWWEVTTEGDCEGRTIKRLGIHEGHIADIAAKLANQVGYSLSFEKAKPQKVELKNRNTSVSISLNYIIGSDFSSKDRQIVLNRWLRSKKALNNYTVEEGRYYNSVIIKTK